MAKPKKTTKTLTLRLLRETKKISDAFTEAYAEETSKELTKKPWQKIEGAWLYTGQIYSNPPGWLSFIDSEKSLIDERLHSGGAGAVIFIPIGNRYVAVCFGHIHIALEDDAFERQFGLKVALNSIPSHQIRSLDIATPDAVTFQKRVQASKDSKLSQFGFDKVRDLARVAGGTPLDKTVGKFMAGRDSLSLTCEIDINDLLGKCKQVLAIYKKDDYKVEYSWFDNLKVVKEEGVLQQLDAMLHHELMQLMSGGASSLHLTPPEIVNYMEGSELHYNGFGSRGATFNQLSIDDYVAELKRCKFSSNVKEIKTKHRIHAKTGDASTFSEQWKLYDCFIYETSLTVSGESLVYVLFGGDWYCVDANFKKKIEDYFASFKRISIVGKTKCTNERSLIADLHGNRKDLLMLDQERINPKGVKGANIEPCDFFSDKKQFIHLKDANSSGPISHLWSQAVVSATALVGDHDFRKELRKIVSPKKHPQFHNLLPKPSESVKREDYTVVFGIMRNPYVDGTIDIPFFSKVSFQPAAQRLEELGFPIAIELIEKLRN